MKPAEFWDPLDNGSVRCRLCPHRCTLAQGKRGICGIRENRDGTLYALTYGRPCSASLDPIEKKPLFHFLPGTTSLSTATVGCNFRCRFCQNHTISQARDDGVVLGMEMGPEELVRTAVDQRSASISYTYTEPTVFFEYARDAGVLARANGLKNVFVSNGFMSAEVREAALAFLDAINCDLKAHSDDTYREVIGGRLQPVLDTIAFFAANGVWVEVTTLVVPGMNDSDDELRAIAAFLASVDKRIPWHVSRFHPTYRMTDRKATPVAAIERAVELGRAAGLEYVYAGNVPGSRSESTSCPACGVAVIERFGFRSDIAGLKEGACAACGAVIPGVWA